jgi:hypothetical protein
MELEYTYFEDDDGFFVGWFDDFPEDVTQVKSPEELEEMLADLYQCLNLAPRSFPIPVKAVRRSTTCLQQATNQGVIAAFA